MAQDWSSTAHFKVDIMTCPVSDWLSVSPVEIQLEHTQKEEGGNPFFRRLDVKGLKYSNLTLTRHVDKDSVELIMWFTSVVGQLLPGVGSVELLDGKGSTIHTWNLFNVVPLSYKGPAFDVSKVEPAKETVTFSCAAILEGLMAQVAGGAASAVGL